MNTPVIYLVSYFVRGWEPRRLAILKISVVLGSGETSYRVKLSRKIDLFSICGFAGPAMRDALLSHFISWRGSHGQS